MLSSSGSSAAEEYGSSPGLSLPAVGRLFLLSLVAALRALAPSFARRADPLQGRRADGGRIRGIGRLETATGGTQCRDDKGK